MDKEYILYCDESEKQGRYYSNFYGGVLVGSSQYERIALELEDQKEKLNLQGEVKWAKVTERYLIKYQHLVELFFSYLKTGHLKTRIMFRQNAYVPSALRKEDVKNQYFKLYYQFIKHAYGLEYAQLNHPRVSLRLYFDTFPENREAASRFKGFLLGLNKNPKIKRAGLFLKDDDITEVESHGHVLLQCLDIVLGAMHFRLNDKHKLKPENSYRRAKRTVAKEKLYKFILSQIRAIDCKYKNFNIWTSTAGNLSDRWALPYMHWNFIPKNSAFTDEFKKGKNSNQKNNPDQSTQTSDA